MTILRAYSNKQDCVRSNVVGESVEGRAIEIFMRGQPNDSTTLILAGMHGDEPKSVTLAQQFIELLNSDSTTGQNIQWIILPVVNPDGFQLRRRRNANRIDLNRNFPTKNWTLGSKRSRMFGGESPASEPETQAVIQVIEQNNPDRIITIHSIGRNRFCNNYDGPGHTLAESMHRFNGYPVTDTIGYSTPGSFGTWAGVERNIPTITLELPSHHSSKQCWKDNRDALLCI